MAFTTWTISGDVADMFGDDFPTTGNSAQVWLEAYDPVMSDGVESLRITGRTAVPIAADGTVSVVVAQGYYRMLFDSRGIRASGRGSIATGAFEVTKNMTLAEIRDLAMPPSVVSPVAYETVAALTASAEQSATEAEAAAATAVDISNIDTSDDVVEALVLNTGGVGPKTTAALSATFARKVVVNALDHGVVADGATDDKAAWQALVTASAPGTVITWTGRSVLGSPIIWKTGVSLVGQGWGRSVLAPTHATNYFSAIQRISSDGASTASPIEDCIFADFEVDGIGIAGTAANVGGKALFIQFARRCQFRNLYLHDTVGTALGCDFLPACLIDGVVVERGGRNWDGVDGGHAGIGIGTGAWEVEDTLITNCHTIDCGQWGIFTEWQEDQPYHSKGLKIVNNVATGAQGPGIADIGNEDVLISGNYCAGNGLAGVTDRRDGITVYAKAKGLVVVDNICEGNAGAGIGVNAFSWGGHTIRGNTCLGNTREGIFVDSPTVTAHTGLTITDNRCHTNGRSGIKIVSLAAAIIKDSRVDRNHCYNNGQALTAGERRGIDIYGGMNACTLSGNRCYDDQGSATQDNGIASAAGTWTDTLMEGNNLVGQATAAAISGTVTGLVRRNNLGYVTEGRGTGTVAAGSATVTVFHGLSATPTAVTVTPRTNEGVWVTTIGASGFIVNRAVTTAALDFTWQAQV